MITARRENQVIALLEAGFSDAEVADELGVSVNSARTYRSWGGGAMADVITADERHLIDAYVASGRVRVIPRGQSSDYEEQREALRSASRVRAQKAAAKTRRPRNAE